MRDQLDQRDFKDGVKRFAYDGGKSKKNAADDDWNTFPVTKGVKETKELDLLKDIWSIQKNVSLGDLPLKPQRAAVHATPTGTGLYSRHGKHNALKGNEAVKSLTNISATVQAKSNFSLTSHQRVGYSYSQPEPDTTTLPKLTPGGSSITQYQPSQSRYSDTAAAERLSPTGRGISRTLIGRQKPSLYSSSSSHLGNSKSTSSGAGSQWPSL